MPNSFSYHNTKLQGVYTAITMEICLSTLCYIIKFKIHLSEDKRGVCFNHLERVCVCCLVAFDVLNNPVEFIWIYSFRFIQDYVMIGTYYTLFWSRVIILIK